MSGMLRVASLHSETSDRLVPKRDRLRRNKEQRTSEQNLPSGAAPNPASTPTLASLMPASGDDIQHFVDAIPSEQPPSVASIALLDPHPAVQAVLGA